MKQQKMKFSAKDMAAIGLMACLITVCAWITIPMTVPVTMQTFGVFCALELLGGKKGTTAILVYLLLGAVGLPVFSGFTGGIGVLLSTTGGYLAGFLLTGLVYWALEGRMADKRIRRLLGMLLGLLLCYALGTVWFRAVYLQKTGAVSLVTVLGWCVAPFVLPDMAKLLLAAEVGRRVKKRKKTV